MSVSVALFLAVGVLILATPAACIPFIAAYPAGFRRKALKLVLERLDELVPERSQIRLQSHVHARWDTLIDLAQLAEHAADDTDAKDRALAVLVGRDGEPGFRQSIEEGRRKYQEAHLRVFSHRLLHTGDLSDLIIGVQSWIRVGERQLLWLSFRDLGPQFYRNIYPRIDSAISHASTATLLITVVAASLVAVATHQNLIGAIMTAAAMLLGMVGIAAVWFPLLLRCTRAYLANTDPQMIRLAFALVASAATLTAVMEALLMLGVLERFWLNGAQAVTNVLDDFHLSPTVWAGIGIFLLDASLLVPTLAAYRIARNGRFVTWERVRAVGRLAGWSSAIPLTIALTASLNAKPSPGGFPEWIRVWVFACWGSGFLFYLASVVLRRRPPDPL
jgi:hypothetical protein